MKKDPERKNQIKSRRSKNEKNWNQTLTTRQSIRIKLALKRVKVPTFDDEASSS